jgi:exodeoxyribonuclease V alpha subunit
LSKQDIQEKLAGVVERVTFHNEQNGWSVLKVSPFREPHKLVTVLIHQAKVFAGATIEFRGNWINHPKYGEQFKATDAIEKKPADSSAMEKYLGSGLIKGVGPFIAKKIVGHFKENTLEIFENRIDELLEVPGIAGKKLLTIKSSWEEHKAIRDVMIFLQKYGISTLFATKIFKTYGDRSIRIVTQNPYRLAHDIYGIGFFSADKIALSLGFDRLGVARIGAGIRQVLASSRDEGHCYLKIEQITSEIKELLREEIDDAIILEVIELLHSSKEIMLRMIDSPCYYSKSLYYDELTVSEKVSKMVSSQVVVDSARIENWVGRYCTKNTINLSDEQKKAVCGIPSHSISILTGGPGCGKTTCTKALVNLLEAMRKKVLLAAPTGRASQRMSEVIGMEAKTIHRLLEWIPAIGNFKRNEGLPLEADFIIVDEVSMLDINLAASLFKAIPKQAQLLLIGDPDQLPAVGAGNVIADLLASGKVPKYQLTKIFRQAEASSIIRFAHEMNTGKIPAIRSPIAMPDAFHKGIDCLFVDADEATREQIAFIQKAKYAIKKALQNGVELDSLLIPEEVTAESVRMPLLTIPDKFRHVDLERLAETETTTEELAEILKTIHPWSTIHYGQTALDTVLHLYTKTIPEWLGKKVEIQVLTPQIRGTLGTLNLNASLQRLCNPPSEEKREIVMGERILRNGDRVIQTRNNYDLNVFNGDIGRITSIDNSELTCEVTFSGLEERIVKYTKEDLSELSLAYTITIHKSQGSEFETIIIPVLGQHFNMLFRNLMYTGLTRARKLAIFVGSRKAFAMAIGKIDNRKRQTALSSLI